MKILLVGEAANHAERLRARLEPPVEIVGLPREAAIEPEYDSAIAADDVVVSLRFRRPAGAPPFRLLHVPGAGLDGIGLAELAPGCAVCNVFEHEIPIAEYVVAAMLEWTIGLGRMRAAFTPQTWSDLYRDRRPHGEIHGATLGIVGFGRIGRAIAARARGFGMRIVAVDAFATDGGGLADAVLPPARLSEMLAAADFVVVACPLSEATRGLFGDARFAAMKSSAVFINISRAELAEEDALYRALESRRIAGAFLDVWYRYPIDAHETVAPSNRPFHDLDNVFATPHSSAWTDALPGRRYAVIAENIRRLVAGEPLLNLVRPAS